jgi:hypothetical protein
VRASNTKKLFLQTVSVTALAVTFLQVPTAARAEDAQSEFIFEFQGGFPLGDSQAWAQSFGPGGIFDNDIEYIRPDTSLGGTIGFRTRADNFLPSAGSGWDVGVFARFGATNTASEGGLASPYFNILGGFYPTFYTAGRAEHREEHLIVDFEARRDVGLGGDLPIATKVMAGIRFAYFNADTETEFVYLPTPSYYVLTDDRESQFIGAGPRVGFDSTMGVNETVSLEMSGALSVLFGRRNTSVVTITPFFGPGGSFVREEFAVVPTVEGSAAIRIQPPGTSVSLSIGVRADASFGAFDQRSAFTFFSPDSVGEANARRVTISPFARLTVPLGDSFDEANSSTQSMTVAAAGGADAPTQTIFEAGISGGNIWRSGNQMNFSGFPDDELETLPLGRIDVLAATRLMRNVLVQGEVAGELAFGDQNPDGVGDDDTYEGGFIGGGQLAFVSDPFLLGIFGGAGETGIATTSGRNQDADHWMFGGQTRILSDTGSFTVQVGVFDTDATDPETISNAVFGRAIGQLFFNGGNSLLQGDLAYIVGEQDPDAFGGVNPVEMLAWGVEFEHQLDFTIADASTSVFLGYQGSEVSEKSTFGNLDRVVDHTVMGGVRVRLGDVNPASRERNTAPRMPNIMRWIGAVPAVD